MSLISYVKQIWNANSFVNPSRMNHIEDGISQACDGVDALNDNKASTTGYGITKLTSDLTGDSEELAASQKAVHELNSNLTDLQTKTSKLSNRLAYITECPVGSTKKITNYKKYAFIYIALHSGSTEVACGLLGASEIDLRFNDGTNHTARVANTVSGDDITFTTTNRENASGYNIVFRGLQIS